VSALSENPLPIFAGAFRDRSMATATRADTAWCSQVLTLAFSNDPAARWMYPDAGQYLHYFPQFVEIFGGMAFAHQTAQILAGAATALWLPPGVHPDEDALRDLIDRSVPPARRLAVISLFDQMDLYPPRTPHWHLPLIGVDPARQRQGHGSALLRHALRRCDEQNLAAHLEATSPANVALYRRHGFEIVGTIRSQDSPPIFPMVRRPIGSIA
jgi:ribosomal protein S18 acetylase RimI-like enzyme